MAASVSGCIEENNMFKKINDDILDKQMRE